MEGEMIEVLRQIGEAFSLARRFQRDPWSALGLLMY